MKVFIIILTIFSSIHSFSQSAFDQLTDTAYKFYRTERFYDSALHYYMTAHQKFPDERPAYISNQIGDCYLQLGDTANAETFYLKCLTFDRSLDSAGFSHGSSCTSLSGIYYNRKEFRKALDYLDYTKTRFRPLRAMHSRYEIWLQFAYKKSRCYYGLNNKDSAIITLGPLIFRPVADVWIDSLEFIEMSLFFVNTIFEVYGVSKARDNLQKSLKEIRYKPIYETYRGDTFIHVDCSIEYAKTKISLDPGIGYYVKRKGEIPEGFMKENLLKEFTESLAYRYIMGLDSLPAITTLRNTGAE